MGVYIEIRDSDNSINGVLDVGNSEDYPLSLTRKISDYKQLNARSGVFSTDFEVPLTENNAQLFSGIGNVNLKNTKQFFKEKDAIIYNEGLQVHRGKIQVLSVKNKNGVDYLSLNFIANNLEWVSELAELALNEINFADNVFNYDTTSVSTSWTNTADDSDFVYAYIERGALYDNTSILQMHYFRPDLFVKRILTTSFNQIGYNLESTFFDTSGFESLILPYFGDNQENWRLPEAVLDDNTVIVGNVSDQLFLMNAFETRYNLFGGQVVSYECSGSIINLPLSSDAGGFFKDTLNTYNTTTYEFDNFNLYGDWIIDYKIYIDALVFQTASLTGNVLELWFEYENTDINVTDRQLIESFSSNISSQTLIEGAVNFYAFENTVGKARFYLKYRSDEKLAYNSFDCSTDRRKVQIQISKDSYLTAKPSSTIQYGLNLELQNVLPNNYYVLELINDLTKMFNLYWDTDTKTNTVKVEPRDDFYKNITNAIDFTDRLDLSKEYEITNYDSVYSRYLSFYYADDFADGYVKRLNEIEEGSGGVKLAGIKNIDLGSDFKDGETIIKHDKIAATSNTGIIDTYFSTSRMWTEFNEERPPFYTNFAPRILSYNYNEKKDEFGNTETFGYYDYYQGVKLDFDKIPYALDRSIVYEDNQLIAEVKEVLTYHNSYKTLTKQTGLIENYYTGTIQSLKEGKNLKVNLVLTLNEFRDLDFSKPIYFSAPEKIQGYWYFESIDNIQVSKKTQSVKVSLNKLVNYEALTVFTKPEIELSYLDAQLGESQPFIGNAPSSGSYTSATNYLLNNDSL